MHLLHRAQVDHGLKVDAIVALPFAQAEVGAAAYLVDEGVVAAAGVLRTVFGGEGDGAVEVDLEIVGIERIAVAQR